MNFCCSQELSFRDRRARLSIFRWSVSLYLDRSCNARAVSWQATHTRNCQRIRQFAICIIGRTYDCRSYFAALAPSNMTQSCIFNGPSRASIQRCVHFILYPPAKRQKTMTLCVSSKSAFFRSAIFWCVNAAGRWYLAWRNCLCVKCSNWHLNLHASLGWH